MVDERKILENKTNIKKILVKDIEEQ